MARYIHMYMAPERILLLDVVDKTQAIDALIDVVGKDGPVTDIAAFRSAIHEREKIVSTGLGFGVAIPHAKIQAVREFFVSVAILKKGVDWNAIDGKPVQLVFLIGGPENDQQTYLQILSKIVLVIRSVRLRKTLLASRTPADVLEIFADK